MTETELMDYAMSVPWLASGLLVLGAVGVVVERVTGLVGPATKVAVWWSDREVRKLRQEARLRAERRRLDSEDEEARVAALRAEVQWLRQEVARLHSLVRCTCTDTSPMRTAVHPSQPVPLPRTAGRPATHRAR